MQTLAAELVRLAHTAAATPGHAAQLSDALKCALAVVDPDFRAGGAAEIAVTQITELLTSASEHMDLLREIIPRPRE
jgi:hypothetical protein